MPRLCLMLALALSTLLAVPAPVRGNEPIRTGDSVEAPELGRVGPLSVGTSKEELVLEPRLHLAAEGVLRRARRIGIRFWYPAVASQAPQATYRHSMTFPGGSKHEVVDRGIARSGAAPLPGKFPLVVVSHGLSGWSEHLSRLGEHLASRGYIMVSIDHRDAAFATVPEFLMSFANVLHDRAADQRAVLAKLADPAFVNHRQALRSADTSRIGLIGYSMGGFGALATAGALYDPAGKPFAALPETIRQDTTKPASAPVRVNALVLIAPWGSQPDNRAWRSDGLAALTVPMLIIDGDHDDVVNFQDGVKWLFTNAKSVDRYMLVYREGRHNIAGNFADLGDAPTTDIIGYATEPVWRQERINQINQHFVTAFLDSSLKGDGARRAYLDVPTPVASDGQWPTKFGEIDRGAYAGDDQPAFWRGFQRARAAGLELYRKQAGH